MFWVDVLAKTSIDTSVDLKSPTRLSNLMERTTSGLAKEINIK